MDTLGIFGAANTEEMGLSIATGGISDIELGLFESALESELSADADLRGAIDAYHLFADQPVYQVRMQSLIGELLSQKSRRDYLLRAQFRLGYVTLFASRNTLVNKACKIFGVPTPPSRILAGEGFHSRPEDYSYSAMDTGNKGNSGIMEIIQNFFRGGDVHVQREKRIEKIVVKIAKRLKKISEAYEHDFLIYKTLVTEIVGLCIERGLIEEEIIERISAILIACTRPKIGTTLDGIKEIIYRFHGTSNTQENILRCLQEIVEAIGPATPLVFSILSSLLEKGVSPDILSSFFVHLKKGSAQMGIALLEMSRGGDFSAIQIQKIIQASLKHSENGSLARFKEQLDVLFQAQLSSEVIIGAVENFDDLDKIAKNFVQGDGKNFTIFALSAQGFALGWDKQRIENYLRELRIIVGDEAFFDACHATAVLLAKNMGPPEVANFFRDISRSFSESGEHAYKLMGSLLLKGLSPEEVLEFYKRIERDLFVADIDTQNEPLIVLKSPSGEEIEAPLHTLRNRIFGRMFDARNIFRMVSDLLLKIGLDREASLRILLEIKQAYLRHHASVDIDLRMFARVSGDYFMQLVNGQVGVDDFFRLVDFLQGAKFSATQIGDILESTARGSPYSVFQVYSVLPKVIGELLQIRLSLEEIKKILVAMGECQAITLRTSLAYDELPERIKYHRTLVNEGFPDEGYGLLADVLRHAKIFYAVREEESEDIQVLRIFGLVAEFIKKYPPLWDASRGVYVLRSVHDLMRKTLQTPNGFYLLKDGLSFLPDSYVEGHVYQFLDVLKDLPPYAHLPFFRLLASRLKEGAGKTENLEEEIKEKIKKAIAIYKDIVVVDAHTKVLMFAGDEERFALGLLEQLLVAYGARKENFLEGTTLKGKKAKEKVIQHVGENGLEKLTLVYFGHGEKEALNIDQGEEDKIRFDELGEALARRAEITDGDLSSVIFLSDACYACNFAQNLEKYLRELGIKKLPIIISTSNLDSLGTGGSFGIDSVFLSTLLMGSNGGKEKMTLEDILNIDSNPRIKAVEDPAVFVPDPENPTHFLEIG